MTKTLIIVNWLLVMMVSGSVVFGGKASTVEASLAALAANIETSILLLAFARIDEREKP